MFVAHRTITHLAGLKEDLVRMEREKMTVDSERQNLSQNLQLTEAARSKLDDEAKRLSGEKQDLTDQYNALQRKLAAVSEELNQV